MRSLKTFNALIFASRCNRNLIFVSMLLGLLSGCGMFGSGYAVRTAEGGLETLGDRVDAWDFKDTEETEVLVADEASEPELPQAELVVKVYREAYDLLEDPVTKNSILQRLAAIDLKTAENLDIAGMLPQSEEAYAVAIAAYTKLLAESDNTLRRDELHYALAKAYGLSGDIDRANEQLETLVRRYPDSPYRLESQFRVAEYQFARAQYREASKNFAGVLAGLGVAQVGELDPAQREFYLGTRYMLGWSEFKNNQYQQAIGHFVQLIQDTVDVDQANFSVEHNLALFTDEQILGEPVFVQDNKLLDDALRAMTLSLAYSPVKESLQTLNRVLDGREFAHWVYAALADHYFAQERYMDSARVYGAYADQWELDAYAPWFMNRKVLVLRYAKFDTEAWEQKAVFADRYHPSQHYYEQQGASTITDFIDQKLSVYIDELASFHHAKARSLASRKESGNATDAVASEISEAYDRASYWYRQKISAFPEDPMLGETYFLLAESLSESSKLPAAIEAYEMAAYGGYDFVRANDAGYAAILGYRTLLSTLPESESNGELLAAWQDKTIESSLLFFETFPAEARRDAVIVSAANELFERGELQRTIDVAERFFADQNLANQKAGRMQKKPQYRLPLLLVSAQAAFALQDYPDAESRFAKAITLMQASFENTEQQRYVSEVRTQQLSSTQDNYASSIYKQAELASNAGDSKLALDHFNRLVSSAPQSKLRVAAQRDAIMLQVGLGSWATLRQAIPAFLSDFPAHPERLDMQKHLIAAMEAEQDWPAAMNLAMQIADELASARTEKTVQNPREFRLLAADFANKSGDDRLRIQSYQAIINSSSLIDEPVLEAHYQLALMSTASNQKTAAVTRYGKILSLESGLAKHTDRTRFIAAASSAELAEVALKQFQVLKIQEPLRETLQKKRESLERAVAAFDRTEAYAIEQFALQATRRKAQIYAEFASAIMNSERPGGLDALALEEYEFLLEEQAYPFEEKAIALYEVNVQRAWDGMQSADIEQSYRALAELMPARYDKTELLP